MAAVLLAEPERLSALLEAAARGAAAGASAQAAARHTVVAAVGAAVAAVCRDAAGHEDVAGCELSQEVDLREKLARPVLAAKVVAGAAGCRQPRLTGSARAVRNIA